MTGVLSKKISGGSASEMCLAHQSTLPLFVNAPSPPPHIYASALAPCPSEPLIAFDPG